MILRTVSLLIAMMVVCSFSTGCATLIRGESQKMMFQTDPPKATVNVDGKDYTSPASVSLRRNKPHTIVVSADGYESITFKFESQWDGASLGNFILPGGSVGFAVDTLKGTDRSFRDLATIKLNKVNGVPTSHPYERYQYRGRILTKEEYDKAMQDEHEYKVRNPD